MKMQNYNKALGGNMSALLDASKGKIIYAPWAVCCLFRIGLQKSKKNFNGGVFASGL